MNIAVVGSGFAGSVIASELASKGGHDVTVFDDRSHVAGNCHTSRDVNTGIMIHHYGPHIFHTDRKDVWDYVNQFSTFGPYVNRVKAVTSRGVFSLPINLLTINQFFNKAMSPSVARRFVEDLSDTSIVNVSSFEDQALRFLGRDLYQAFFYGYTKKQWGVEPRDLPASILRRLPVRFNYDDNYYASRYQGIPVSGYTAIVEKMLDHPRIEVCLGQRFDSSLRASFDHVFYSGGVDSFYGFDLGMLPYRTLKFERQDCSGDFQGNAVINYCDEAVPWTRVSEHKHFAPWESHDKTAVFFEYSRRANASDIPYYPVHVGRNDALDAYMARTKRERGVTFIGRLGTFRYLDMDQVIGETLDLARMCLAMDPDDWPSSSCRT